MPRVRKAKVKPSKGTTKAERSRLAKRARKGEAVAEGNFDEVAAAAGGGEKGRKIAASKMWRKAAKKGVSKTGKIKGTRKKKGY